MGKLDSVVMELAARKRQAPSPKEFMEAAQPERMAEPESAYLRQMVQVMDKTYLHPNDVKDGFIALASGLVSLDNQMAELTDALSKKPETFDSVNSEIAALRSGLSALVKSIQGIKLPEVKIPEYKTTDLSPVTEAIGDLRVLVASMERVAETKEVIEPPRDWTFEVKRTPGGYIKTIEAKAK